MLKTIVFTSSIATAPHISNKSIQQIHWRNQGHKAMVPLLALMDFQLISNVINIHEIIPRKYLRRETLAAILKE